MLKSIEQTNKTNEENSSSERPQKHDTEKIVKRAYKSPLQRKMTNTEHGQKQDRLEVGISRPALMRKVTDIKPKLPLSKASSRNKDLGKVEEVFRYSY